MIEKNNKDLYTGLSNDQLNNIKEKYKVIEVPWLDATQVNYKLFNDNYFENSSCKKEMVEEMLNYYLNHQDKDIYKKTDYLCNKKEKICICNIHANDLRKIYEGINYDKQSKYISWYK